MLTLKDMDIFICLINRSVVDAIWSSLSFELFYLTNDDEERYSIQAHQYIFRKKNKTKNFPFKIHGSFSFLFPHHHLT